LVPFLGGRFVFCICRVSATQVIDFSGERGQSLPHLTGARYQLIIQRRDCAQMT